MLNPIPISPKTLGMPRCTCGLSRPAAATTPAAARGSVDAELEVAGTKGFGGGRRVHAHDGVLGRFGGEEGPTTMGAGHESY